MRSCSPKGDGVTEGAARVSRRRTVLASPGPIATNAYMYKAMPYDPAKWVPVAVVATSPYVLVVSPRFDAATLHDVIARASIKPGQLTAATPGIGSLGMGCSPRSTQRTPRGGVS